MMACFCLGIPIGVLFNRIIAVRGADESMRKRTCIAGYGVVSLGCFLVGYILWGYPSTQSYSGRYLDVFSRVCTLGVSGYQIILG